MLRNVAIRLPLPTSLTLLCVLLFGIPLSAASVTFTVTGTYGSVSIFNGSGPALPPVVAPPVEGSSFMLQFSTLDTSPYPPSSMYPFWTFPVAGGAYHNNG